MLISWLTVILKDTHTLFIVSNAFSFTKYKGKSCDSGITPYRILGKVTHPAVIENSPCLHLILQPQDPGVRLLARW